MTIASATNKSGPYNGNGVTVAFAGTFKISDQDHVQVILADADGVETVQTITTEYTVSGVGGSGFTVTMLVAPPSGSTVTLIRDVPFTQELDLQNQGAYYAESVEEAFDLAAARDQQLQEQVSRSVKIPASADVAELDTLIANIVLLGDSAADLAALAAISADVETLAAINAAISTVAGISTAVTTVAGISVAVQSVAAVEAELLDVHAALAEIIAAPGYAAAADASADAAAASAAAAATFNPANYMLSASYPTLVSLEALTLAAGDLFYATAADTLARLPKGTALQHLRMNAGATAPEWAAAASGSRRNRWVNPAFQVSQENGNTLGTANGYYPADQIAMYFTAATAAMSVQRVQARTLKGSLDQIEFKCTTAKASLGASDYVTLTQNIEGQEIADLEWGTANAKPLVISKEVKLPEGLYHWHVQNSAGNRHIAVPFTISSGEANTAVRKTVSVPGDVSGTWLTTNAIGATVDLVLAAGSSKTGGTLGAWGATAYLAQATQFNILSSTANVVRLADVQVCADPDSTGVAPAWELPDCDDTLAQCKRYYRKSFLPSTNPAQNVGLTNAVITAQVTTASTSQALVFVSYDAELRISSPTLTIYNPSAANAQIRGLGAGADWSGTGASVNGSNGHTLNGTSPGGSGAGQSAAYHYTANARF